MTGYRGLFDRSYRSRNGRIRGFDYGDRNEEGHTIIEFATAHDLVVPNSFMKTGAHLITFQSKDHNSQFDYLLVRKGDLRACKDCRVLLEGLLTLVEECDAKQMWNILARSIREAVKDSLGVASGSARSYSSHKESCWFDEKVQSKVALNETRFKELLLCHEGHPEDRDMVRERSFTQVAMDSSRFVLSLYSRIMTTLSIYGYLVTDVSAACIPRLSQIAEASQLHVKKKDFGGVPLIIRSCRDAPLYLYRSFDIPFYLFAIRILYISVQLSVVSASAALLFLRQLEDAAEEQESTQSDEEEAADYEHDKEELTMWLTVVPDEEETIDSEILSAKYPIVDWESQNLGSVDMEDLHVYKIIRADGNTSYHKSLSSMLRKFDRQDLVDLHRLVMKRFEDTTPEVEKRYPLIKEMLQKMLNWKLEAEAESTMAFELLKFIKSQLEE
ncbi:ribonuclease H-like domain-containing protein [Tanacetum coccineum]|uniref:Ribonuclease H-like domain-containing protein n=1 Tax=Tanacetum coccineum TaxID=301880 RepID=A0ABQ5FU96_9ASTR